MRKMMKYVLLFVVSMLVCSFTTMDKVTIKSIVPSKMDYSSEKYWAVLENEGEKAVDVFYVYPTKIKGTSENHYFDIGKVTHRNAAVSKIKEHCSAFDHEANVYAPFYRQVGVELILSPSADSLMAPGREDIINAFAYYLEHYNKNKPIILASHSQGTMTLTAVLPEILDDEVKKRIVAAYLIGASVTQKDCERIGLPFAKGADDTGVVISYNSQSPDLDSHYDSPLLRGGALCINPLNWTTSDVYAGKELNLGAVFSDGIQIDHFTDAQIDVHTGALICRTPDIDRYSGKGLFPRGVYHRYEYAFFMNNLRENVSLRCQEFRKGEMGINEGNR